MSESPAKNRGVLIYARRDDRERLRKLCKLETRKPKEELTVVLDHYIETKQYDLSKVTLDPANDNGDSETVEPIAADPGPRSEQKTNDTAKAGSG